MRIAFVLLSFFIGTASAQYSGPAVEACRKYAQQEIKKADGRGEVIFVVDQNLVLERYTRKLGTQFVSSILTGHGAVAYDRAPAAELEFVCLLANDRQPVFFQWMRRQNAMSFVQCTRSEELKGKPRPCLELLLQVAENDLTQIYANRFQEANAAGGELLARYRASSEAWLKYREAECARQRDYAPKGADATDFAMACLIDLTRRRGLDMRVGP